MLRKIRSLVSNSDHFGIYDNLLTDHECKRVIDQFEKSNHTPGKVYKWDGASGPQRGVHPELKSSEELSLSFKEGGPISNIIGPRICEAIHRYNAENPPLKEAASWTYEDKYNIQRYVTKDDGYKVWHCEHGPGIGSVRVMAWMFYLNNAKSGTEFMSYPTVRAKMGRCVVWPAAWTHVHRGAPNKGLKYIVTGWISFIDS